MGNIFSGWHGRRSLRPYFDELPRITIMNCKLYPPGRILFPLQGGYVEVWKILITIGCITDAPRLRCAKCGRACRVLYADGGKAYCHRCSGARYRSTATSPKRRAYASSLKALRRLKIDTSRPGWKPKWQRWSTFKRREDAALAAMPAIDHVESAPYVLLERIERKISNRKRPPK